MVTQEQVLKTLIAAPDGFHTGSAVMFAPQKTAQAGNAANEILHGEGTARLFEEATQYLDFFLSRHLLSGRLGLGFQSGPQLEDAHRHH